jgi:hypothetical protein
MRKDFNLGEVFRARCPPEKVKSILMKLDFKPITTYTMETLQAPEEYNHFKGKPLGSRFNATAQA